MVVSFRLILVALVLAISLGASVHAGEAEDAQVERGVAFYDDGDYEQAKAVLLPLAEAGHPKAMNMIGLMHDGTPVFPNDPIIECDWYERSANAGYVSGIYNLSVCFNHGRGRPKDHGQMLYWRTKAAESGFIPAMINLSALDDDKGEDYRYWLRKAGDHGSRFALVDLWLEGYKQDVPDVTVRDIVCVSVFILILDGDILDCD